jgi:GT2 family glycosyltransferase
MQKQLTIGLVLRNEERQIQDCLQAVVAALPQDFEFEFIIADNDSSDLTVQKCEQFFLPRKIQYQILSMKKNNMGLARQQIILAAKYDWVYFTDADCRLENDSLAILIQAIEEQDSKLAAVGGANQAPAGEKFYDLLRAMSKTPLGNFGSTQMKQGTVQHTVSHLSTTSVLYRRQAVLGVKNFNPAFDWVGEDLDLSTRLRQNHFHLLFVPQSKVLHYHKLDFPSWTRKMFKYGWAQPQVFLPKGIISYRLLPLVSLFLLLFPRILFVAMVLYLLACLFESIRIAFKEKISFINLFLLMTATHVAYFAGQLFSVVALLKNTVYKIVRLFLGKQTHREVR